MEIYTIRCTPEQTKRAYNLGAPIQKGQGIYHGVKTISITPQHEGSFYVIVPTIQQMIGWLRKEKYFSFNVIDGCYSNIKIKVTFGIELIYEDWGDTEKNTLKAIDAALSYLEKKGE